MITTDAPPCPKCGTIAIWRGRSWGCPGCKEMFDEPRPVRIIARAFPGFEELKAERDTAIAERDEAREVIDELYRVANLYMSNDDDYERGEDLAGVVTVAVSRVRERRAARERLAKEPKP